MAEHGYEYVEVDGRSGREGRRRLAGWLGAHAAGIAAAGVSLALVGTAAAFITRTGKHTTGTFTYGDVQITLTDGNNAYGDGNTSSADYAHVMPNEQFNYKPTIAVTEADSDGAYLFAKVTIPKAVDRIGESAHELFVTNTKLETATTSTSVAAATGSASGGKWLRIDDSSSTDAAKDQDVATFVTRTYAYVNSSGALQAVKKDEKAILFDTIHYDPQANKKVTDTDGQIEVKAYAIQAANLGDANATGDDKIANATTGSTLAATASNSSATDPQKVWNAFNNLMKTQNDTGAQLNIAQYTHGQS